MYLFPVFLLLKGVYLSDADTHTWLFWYLLAFPFGPSHNMVIGERIYEGKLICTSFRGLLLLLSNSLILFNHVDTKRGWVVEGLKSGEFPKISLG